MEWHGDAGCPGDQHHRAYDQDLGSCGGAEVRQIGPVQNHRRRRPTMMPNRKASLGIIRLVLLLGKFIPEGRELSE